MRCASIFAATTGLASVTSAANILITNDDGFGTSNIRELYRAMKAFGHNCYIVASSSDQSGMGGRAVFTTEANLTADTEFGIVKKGAPSLGTDPNDSHIWYYNGTPAVQVFTALDYILPTFGEFKVPDLVLSGPNFGQNLGPFLYTLSGTIGATYAAIERGYPAIAYSATYGVQTPYYYVNASTKAGLQDPATITGRLAANLANELIKKANGGPLLPKGYGLNVNIPYITSYTNNSCVNPPYILTRLTGGALEDKAVYNKTSGLLTYANISPDGLNTCINGDCSLPGETLIAGTPGSCQSSVTVFDVDYDAPYSGECKNVSNPYSYLPTLVQPFNTTGLVGGLGANTSVAGVGGNGTTTTATGTAGSTTGTATLKPTGTSTSTATSAPVTAAAVVGNRADVGFVAAVFGVVLAVL